MKIPIAEDDLETRREHQNTPDVIVSDRMMPNMDGIEFCRRVRGREGYTFFIILSNRTEFRR